MARSTITNTTDDLISDSGSVLWSIVTGEQLEFPVILNFVEDASLKESNNYTYEAVVIEGDNTEGGRPNTLLTNGAQTVLGVRLPIYMGVWDPDVAYNKEDVVFYSVDYYKLKSGAARISDAPPSIDGTWEVTTLNTIYIQFFKELGANWAKKASVDNPVYGFFELRVTEPNDPIFVRTWKPVRGMVELLFSPTQEVPDVP